MHEPTRAQIEYRLDAMLRADGMDDAYRYNIDESYRTMAAEVLRREAQGFVKLYRLLVVPEDVWHLPGTPYPWHYTAVEPQEGLKGCLHQGWAAPGEAARMAVIEHTQRCAGKGI